MSTPNPSATSSKLVGANAFASIEYRLGARRIRIGSGANNDLILAHKSVSDRHALIRKSFGRYFITDLGSTSGTFLNGARVDGLLPIRPGDELRFGAARFAVVGGKQSASKVVKYVTPAVAVLLLAAIGYLSVEFVANWENLERLDSTSVQVPASSLTATATSPVAAMIASEAHVLPTPFVAEPRATVVSGVAPWLAAINEYRASSKLPPVIEDPKLSDGDRKHATYLVKNYAERVSAGLRMGAEAHREEEGNPWYTPEGRDAGAHSDVDEKVGCETQPSPTWAIDNWIVVPFHRMWILNPRLHRVGYGEFRDKKVCVAALNVGDGAAPIDGEMPFGAPIEFPANNSTTAAISFSAEWPTPLSACPGYSFPAGMPVTIQLGTMVETKLSDYSITRDGHGVESCGIDASTYQNPVASEQERGRAVLRDLGAAIIIPRYPLKPGARYSVNATLNNHAYEWSFSVVGPQSLDGKSAPTPSELR